MHGFNVTSRTVLTGKQDLLLFLLSPLTLEGLLSLSPLGLWHFHLRRERLQECHLSPLPLWIAPGRWRMSLPVCGAAFIFESLGFL